MSIVALGIIGLVILLLLGAGVIVGWAIGTNDRQIDILSRRLAADAAISRATRDTLHAMRETVRRHSR